MLLLFVLSLLPGLLLNPALVLDWLYPISQNSVHLDPLRMGRVEPDAVLHGELKLHNNSYRAIDLAPVYADCGCLVVQDAPRQLPAHSSTSIQFSLHAPRTPGSFTKSLLFSPADDYEIHWLGKITGVVEAAIWAEPAALELRRQSNGAAEAVVIIWHGTAVEIGEVTCSDAMLQIVDSREIEGGRRIKVRVAQPSPAEGDDPRQYSLQVSVKNPTPTSPQRIEIPVRCASNPLVSFVPAQIELEAYRPVRLGDAVLKTTALAVSPTENAGELHVESIVPWASVTSEVVAKSTLKLEMSFDIQRMPQSVHEPVVQITLPDHRGSAKLAAVGSVQ